MDTRMQTLDLIANNLANASSPGYKADRERFSSYLSGAAAEAILAGESKTLSEMPMIEDRYTEFRQSGLQETGNPTDVALEGSGFFVVDTPRGARYTRAGNFRLAPDGELRTRQGYAVKVLETERPGKLAADPKIPLEIDAEGAIWQQQRRLGKLSVQDFSRPDLLRKEEGVYFAAQPGMTPRAAKATVSNKALEVSNVDAASASMQLVTASREFQMLNRAYSVVSTARRGVLEQVAKW
jgi:flagellar basal body rod protein FlgG